MDSGSAAYAAVPRRAGGTVRALGRLGYCPQKPGLFDLLSTDEHLALFAPALGRTRREAIREGRRLLAELGFRAGDGTQARHLSGGAQQKLNLALALLGDARVLLLDEPYQALTTAPTSASGSTRTAGAPRGGHW